MRPQPNNQIGADYRCHFGEGGLKLASHAVLHAAEFFDLDRPKVPAMQTTLQPLDNLSHIAAGVKRTVSDSGENLDNFG